MNIISVSSSDTGDNESSETLASHLLLQAITFKEEIEDCTRSMNDVWVGVILTLLVISVVFMICAGLFFHKFQQWKESCSSRNRTPFQIYHSCNGNAETNDVESLPSYTIVSGLPSYDDALEQYRHSLNSEIILNPNTMIKIFEKKTPNKDQSSGREGETSRNTVGLGSGQNETDRSDHLTVPLPCPKTAATLTISTVSMQTRIMGQCPMATHFVNLSRCQMAEFNRKRSSIQSIFDSQANSNARDRHCSNCSNGQQQHLEGPSFTVPIGTAANNAIHVENGSVSMPT